MNQHLVRVSDGEAVVSDGKRSVKVKSGHLVDLATSGPLKAPKFDKKGIGSRGPLSLDQPAFRLPRRSQCGLCMQRLGLLASLEGGRTLG